MTIAPSLFDSGMTAMMSDKVRASLTRVMDYPLGPGKPVEFARVVREDVENSMLNGTVIRLDGGMRMPSKCRHAKVNEAHSSFIDANNVPKTRIYNELHTAAILLSSPDSLDSLCQANVVRLELIEPNTHSKCCCS